MRGKIFDDLMMFIGYYLPIFIITLGGVIFILTSIFKFYHINNPSQYYISIHNQNNQNNQNSNLNTINSTIMVNIYYQNGFNIYYVPSFIENLSNWNIFYNITNTFTTSSTNSSLLQINPPNITNTNSTLFDISAEYSGSTPELESIINLSNNTFEGNNVIYTYNETEYECHIVGNNDITYQAGDFAYFCILCKPISGNNPSIQNYYLSEPEYINITPAIYLLGNSYSFPNLEYYNYTVNNVEIVNGTYLAIPLSNNGGYSMEDFQNILVTIGPPLSYYIQQSPYVGDNVVFLVNYDGKYYALPSWYAGQYYGTYYFFINLLNIPSLYNSNFGCNIISIFVGFSNENLLPYLNGTIGGDPYALNSSDPASAVEYDNGLNVFPIYVNFYPYPNNESVEEQEISCSDGSEACFINNQSNNVLPTYNNISIYVNGTNIIPQIIATGELEGLMMDNGTNQGSYALITSNVLQNTFNQLSQSQNGLGLQTFAYFSGIPWEDTPKGNFLGTNPLVSAAVVLSYVSNNQFYADTVSDYNTNDSTTNRLRGPRGSVPIGNQNIGINVGGDTYLPLNFPVFMYEYAWAFRIQGPGPGYSSGYYVGILQYNGTLGLGYFLTTQYNANSCSSYSCTSGYYDYYYSGSGWSSTGCGFLSASKSLHYYFELVSTQGNQGKEFKVCDNSYPLPFIPPDQQNNNYYSQYGVFWLYNWFQAENNNNMNIFFLMNGNIFNYSLALEQYSWNGGSAYAIPPMPPGHIFCSVENICELLFAQSYINAYNTAFNQPVNYQKALYAYAKFSSNDTNGNFVPGTFGFKEEYNKIGERFSINYLTDSISNYIGTPYLFISAGSGGGSGFMYLDWVIVTYGVPYVVSVS